METIEVAIKICLSVQLHQQISLLQQIRQIQGTDEAICTILQEYFTLMAPQLTQNLIPFQSLWIHNVLQQQGVVLAQLQRSVSDIEQLIQLQESSKLIAFKSEPRISPNSASFENLWESIGLNATIADRGITGTQLAERITTSPSSISRRRNQPSFQNWTRERDPYNIGWEYRVSTCRFHPIRSDT